MKYCPGGTLAHHLKHQKKLFMNERVAKFYIAELICALSGLHSKLIVHRDVKPKNILFDEAGHIHLADFSTIKKLRQRANYLVDSKAGTHLYRAPEVTQSRLYGFSCDYYPVGVILYEMLHGSHPHQAGSDMVAVSSTKLYHLSKKLSDECRSLLTALLQRDPCKRIGCADNSPTGWEAVKAHEFFNDINWKKLVKKKVKPPLTIERRELKPLPGKDIRKLEQKVCCSLSL